jgi:hypothetical protein
MVKAGNRLAARALAALALGAAIATPSNMHAQQAGAKTPTTAPAKAPAKAPGLSVMDYIEIQQLVARYGYALDTGAEEGTGSVYAGLWTRDAQFVGPGIADDTIGREKLGALAMIRPGGRGGRGPTYVSHFLMNHLIEPSPEGATGKVYLLVVNFKDDGTPHSLSMGGHYEDIYAKTSEGWLFKRREFFRGKVVAPPTEARPSLVDMRPLPAAVTAPASNGALTPMDYIDIRKLVANYAYGLDTGADNGYMYADNFAPGAVFGRATGRENLANLARREPHGPAYVRHFLTNVVIEPSPEGARGRQYLAVIDVGEGGKPTSFFLGGKYDDVYEKTPQGWKFKSRNLTRAKSAAPSTPSAPAAAPTPTPTTPPPAPAPGR